MELHHQGFSGKHLPDLGKDLFCGHTCLRPGPTSLKAQQVQIRFQNQDRERGGGLEASASTPAPPGASSDLGPQWIVGQGVLCAGGPSVIWVGLAHICAGERGVRRGPGSPTHRKGIFIFLLVRREVSAPQATCFQGRGASPPHRGLD